MPRPKRRRCISARPEAEGFVPSGTLETGEVMLTLEELEAVRLSDYEGFDQARAAEVMEVSRQTFGRILRQARYNIAKALVTAKRLNISGGCYEMRRHRGRGQQAGFGNRGRGMGPGRNMR